MSFDEIELTQKLIQTPGLSGAEGEVADQVEDAMNVLGFRNVYRDQLGNVIGLVGPQAETTALLFDAHMDVVPVAGEWRMDPYGGEIVDGRLYGRGSTDMKGALAAAICGTAAAAKSGRLSRQVAVSATVLEETLECAALAAVVEQIRPEQVVICEPSNLTIKLGQKGRAEILLTIEGIPAHAAFPDREKNPIQLAAKALDALEKIEFPKDPFIGEAILVATDIISDPYPSISLIPPRVTVRFDPAWEEQFERLAQRIGRRKAIVAIARKLLVVIWHVLYHRRVDRQADPERVVRYFLAWGRQAKAFARLGLKASEFARQQLDVLGIGQELPALITFGVTYRLPPSSLPVVETAVTPA